MRASSASRIEPLSGHAFVSSGLGWLQAGFSSFAYRLAHLRLAAPIVIGSLSVVFFLV